MPINLKKIMKKKRRFTIDDYLQFSVPNIDYRETYIIEKELFEILSKRKRIRIEELEEYFRKKNISLEKLRYVVEKMLKEGKIYISDINEISLVKHKKTYTILVERVYRGGATVIVNNKFRAKLKSYNSPIPVKKGEIYEVVGELYNEDGVLNLRIIDVVKKIKL